MPRKRTPVATRCCEVCGILLAPNPGYPAKVCSDACRRVRNSARERARYRAVKDSPEWRETRQQYLDRLEAKAAQEDRKSVV